MAKAKTRTVTRYVSKPRRRRKSSFTLPLAVMAPASFVAIQAFYKWQNGNFGEGLNYLTSAFTGFDFSTSGMNVWDVQRLKNGLLPVGMGIIAHKLASRFGVNRALASAGVPILRL